MSENTEDIGRNAENAARSLVELVSGLQARGIEHSLEAHRIYSFLTHCAGNMKTALTLLRTSVEGLQDKGLLMSDYRGEPLDEVLQRYTESTAAAEQLAGVLGESDSAVERRAYKEGASGETEPTTADRFFADLVTDLRDRGIEYPLEAYRIYSFLTRCAGEIRTALTLLKTCREGLHDDEVLQRYAESSRTAEQFAAMLGKAYSAVGHLAYKETPEGQESAAGS